MLFPRCEPHFFIIFSLSLSSLTSQLITEHTLLDLLFNALVCFFLFRYLSFKFKIMVHVRGARAGASGILPSRAGMCVSIAIKRGRGSLPTCPADRSSSRSIGLLFKKATLGARQDAPVENSRLSIVS